jgi:sarcosine oxidase subunit beta
MTLEEKSMRKSADICIIGGGIIGASIACHLSKTNKRVILLERKSIGSGSARATFGLLVIQLFKYFGVQDSYVDICMASLEMFMDIEKELNTDMQYKKTGGMVVIKDQEDYQKKSKIVETLQAKGIEIDIIDKKKTLAIAPALNGDHILGASFSPVEAEIHPHRLVDAYVKNAQKNGVTVFCDTPVKSISKTAGSDWVLQTPKGEFNAEICVNATGKWANDICKQIGIQIPMKMQRGQVLMTGAIPPILDIAVQHIPVPKVDAQGNHIAISTEIRQMKNGNLMIGGTREDHQVKLINTYEGVLSIARRAVELVPAVKDTQIIRAYSGVRNIPDDGFPVLGFVNNVPGFVNAVMHVGVTLAPITGKLIAELIVNGKTSYDISDFYLSRFNK